MRMWSDGRLARSSPITDDAVVSAQATTTPDPDNEPSPSDWRDQVSAKVKHYKTLKPRKERYPSLQLQFDTVVPLETEISPLAAEREEFLAQRPNRSSAPAIFEPEPRISYPASTDATARVLEFPRPERFPSIVTNSPNPSSTARASSRRRNSCRLRPR